MNPTDEVIEEIREARRILSAEYNHDPARYIDYLKSLESKYARQVALFREIEQPSEPVQTTKA